MKTKVRVKNKGGLANKEHLQKLKDAIDKGDEGINVWNQRMGDGTEIKPYLRGADLRGAYLHNAWLSQAELSEADLSDSDLTWAMLFEAALRGANLKNADLRQADLTDADLRKANLCEAKLGQDVSGANMEGAKLKGACFIEGSNLSQSNLRGADLTAADLFDADLSQADLRGARLIEALLRFANLTDTDLRNANASHANLRGANLTRANLSRAKFVGTSFSDGSNLSKVDLSDADLSWADLHGANLCDADLRRARLCFANLREANLRGADLREADLRGAQLIYTNLTKANLTGCRIYGIAAWDLELSDDTEQSNLVITPSGEASNITVDNLEVAQFIYLLLKNEKIRDLIDTFGEKGVLILGRFTDKRKAVLDAIREKLRGLGFVPMMFDFEKPTQRDFTETIKTLAGLSRFIIADITNPRSSPLELQATMPDYMIPFVPIIQEDEEPFAMFQDLQQKYGGWVLPVLKYDTANNLLNVLEKAVVKPALDKADLLLLKKAEGIRDRHVKDYLK